MADGESTRENPRLRAFCRCVLGLSVADALTHAPGPVVRAYARWVQARAAEWRAARGLDLAAVRYMSPEQHRDLDVWIEAHARRA